MHWVYVYNRNNIWCAMMLSLENRIGNHRVKSLLNLWIGLQMHLINPLNLITRGRYRHCMILRVKRFCARPTLADVLQPGLMTWKCLVNFAQCFSLWNDIAPVAFIPDCILCCIVKCVATVLEIDKCPVASKSLCSLGQVRGEYVIILPQIYPTHYVWQFKWMKQKRFAECAHTWTLRSLKRSKHGVQKKKKV